MKNSYLLFRSPALALIFSIVFGFSTPVVALAATKSSTTQNASASGTIDPSSLLVESGKRIVLYGTASSTTKVRFEVTNTKTSKSVGKSKTLKVRHDGSWSGSISKKVKDGTYTVTLYSMNGSKKKEIVESTLIVGVAPASLSVSPILLLGGGTTNAGATVPISYLQVKNVSSSTVAIKGFWVAQNGTAPTGSIIGFSSVDDKGLSRTSTGGTEGTTVFANGKGYIPSTATLAPGERKLFTLKAQLSASAGNYAGNSLMLDVTGIDAAAGFKNAFPIKGTTWIIAR